MGLFINQIEHQEMFKNQGEIQAPNQNTSTVDPLAEFMLRQERAYALLRDYNHVLENLVAKQNRIQEKKSQEIHNKLNKLKNSTVEHQKFEGQVLDKMSTVDDKINDINESNRALTSHLKKIELANEELVQKMTEQISTQEKLSDQLTEQETIQKVNSTRLENQEISLEKVIRQLDYLRSIIYERTHFLIEKIEEGYHTTSAYIYKTMKDSKQPSSLISEKQKIDEKS